MPIPYILVIVLICTTHSQCPPAFYTTNLTTDIIQLSSNSQPTTVYAYTFKSSFQQTPQVSLAVPALAASKDNALTNPFFYIYAQNVSRGGMQIYTYSQNERWRISKLALMSGHNTQLLLGSAILQNPKSTAGNNSTRLTFQISIKTTLPVNNNQIARGFINGFTGTDRFASLSLASTALTRDKVVFGFDAGTGGVHVVWVSYVVFNLNNREFSAYGGNTAVGPKVSDTADLLKGFSAVQNVLFGINALQAHPQESSIGLSAEIDSNFLLSYTSSSGSFVLTYIFIGVPANATCSNCLGNRFFMNGMCVSQCSGNTVGVSVGGGQMCRACPAGTGLIAVNNACVCPQNSQFVNNRCVQSLTGLNVQLSQNLALKSSFSSSGEIVTSNGVTNIVSGQQANQNINTVSSTTVSSFSLPFVISGPPGDISLSKGQAKIAGITSTSTKCQVPNSYFNGNQCVCIVSYVYQNGLCVLPQSTNIIVPALSTLPPNASLACQQNAYYNGSNCVCNPSYYLLSNKCIKCQANSQWNGSACACNPSYYSSNGQCILQRSLCPPNSVDNGLGICICTLGYTMVNGQCVLTRATCPPNSTFANNACICNKGFFNISGVCSQCPSGAFWSSQSKVCVHVCGVNSFYNTTLGNCSCIPTFGLDSTGACQQCTGVFYLSSGYCVTCPVNSVYNRNAQGCLCQNGYQMSEQGICVAKCRANEVYNSTTTLCDCPVDSTRIEGVCVPCVNNLCISCPPNSIPVNGKCACSAGYITNSFGICVQCLSLPNTFTMNDFCATCPNNQIFNHLRQSCECPLGKTLSGNLCVMSCLADQLLDSNGNCYSCGLNQFISNGACVCKPGYVSNGCGGCSLSCAKGYFSFMGQCAICPLNMNYYELIEGCICPNGQYMNPITNICEKSLFDTTCFSGMFYDGEKCSSCPLGCSICSSLTNCSDCQAGYSLGNGLCQFQAVCGDGLINGNETCDAGIKPQAGCSQCSIVLGYTCTGRPSVCYRTVAPPPPVPLSLKGNINVNSNNIFLTLQTTPTFTFADPTAMSNFMKSAFSNRNRPTTYCVQQKIDLSLFDCLMIYPSGIPNTKFTVTFSYSKDGYSGNTTVTIDPLKFLSIRK